MPTQRKQQSRAIIDRRILRLHYYIADKVLADHAHIDNAKITLESRYASGLMRYGSYMLWHSILETIDEPTLFKQLLLAEDSRTASLRRATIFTGVLSEEEREKALAL